MAFTESEIVKGKIYIPKRPPGQPKKYRCRDCHCCQMCSESRCSLCRPEATARIKANTEVLQTC